MSNLLKKPGFRATAAACVTAFLTMGCVADNTVRVRSSASTAADRPTLPTAAYTDDGSGGGTIYLTDLGPESLDSGKDIKHLSGRIVQVKMFLTPAAGSTPIGRSACTATIRHIVLANGNIGVYSGAGFLWPSGNLGDPRFGGTVEGATMRLTGSAGSFADRLGAATFDATFSARRDEPLARRIGARVDDVLLLTGESASSAR